VCQPEINEYDDDEASYCGPVTDEDSAEVGVEAYTIFEL